MKELLNYLLSFLVSQPEAVEITETEETPGVLTLTLKVASEDMGKVIGKEGKIITSLRNLIKIRAVKEQKLVNLVLAE